MKLAIGRYHGGEVIPEEAAKGESQPNGRVEDAGKLVRGFTRLWKSQIEENIQTKIENQDILEWMIRWAAMFTSRYLVGKYGENRIWASQGERMQHTSVAIRRECVV